MENCPCASGSTPFSSQCAHREAAWQATGLSVGCVPQRLATIVGLHLSAGSSPALLRFFNSVLSYSSQGGTFQKRRNYSNLVVLRQHEQKLETYGHMDSFVICKGPQALKRMICKEAELSLSNRGLSFSLTM